ncbi:VOC family protein [Thalassobacillus hwangdonensis]|uniref:VOC family protein n=1 Tax=Thalassobacillus hwangdonensis TaxID=546108 RepID=A0ABW3KZ47_9BACI
MKTTIHPKTTIDSVHLLVEDLHGTADFYRSLIGFEVLEEKQDRVSFAVDGTSPLLTLEQTKAKDASRAQSAGLYHFAILVPDRVSLSLSLRHLIKNNYPLQGASDHGFSEAIYLQDPEGNGIEIYADRPKHLWQKDASGQLTATTSRLDVEGLLKLSEDKVWSGLPTDTIIGHVHLHVSSIDDTEKFYVDGLGFDKMFTLGGNALFVSAGGYHHHIAMNVWGRHVAYKQESSIGLKHFTIKLPDLQSFNTTIERVKHNAITFEQLDQSITLTDPSGIKVIVTT